MACQRDWAACVRPSRHLFEPTAMRWRGVGAVPEITPALAGIAQQTGRTSDARPAIESLRQS